uniref:non-ribosomal peptide synthase/polyketide synthase n=1 Tax=Pseudomonas sp. NBRC 111119 TaxID=1661034 RepID=UPI0009EC47EB
MNAEKSLKLACRFIELPLEKRRVFLDSLRAEKIDFSMFPIPAGVAAPDSQALSYAQRRMWFLWQLDPQGGAYNLPGAVRLTGRLNLAAMEQAFEDLIARHETLRTVFQRQADGSVTQVATQASCRVEQVDLSHLTPVDRESAVAERAQAQSLQPFDLTCGPLMRAQLLKLAEQQHVLLLTLHHIVSDGWSMNVLIDEFIRLYDGHERNIPARLPELPIQYSDYALWQRRWLEAGEQARQLDYWTATLGEEHPVLELQLDHARPAMPSYRGTRYDFVVDQGLVAKVRSAAQQQGVTLFMFLLGAFNVLLHRYTGQGDLRVGVPIANRNRAEVEGLIGFFVNTQVLRCQFDAQTRVSELLQSVKAAALGAQAHQDLPFEQLVEALQLERNLSHTPLFQVMYNHQPQVADITSVSTASGLELSQVQWQSRTTQFDLTLDTFEKAGTLHAALTYATDLFRPATIERMAQHWLRLLQAMVDDPSQRVGDLPMLEPALLHQVVHEWNQTAVDYPLQQCVHTLIEAQVERTPDAPAVLFGARQLTYAQLDARANQLAHWLIARGAGPDSLVGICVDRSLEMVIGLLAILKAGAAYVPLDPEYPADRLAYMIEDSAISVLLTQGIVADGLPIDGVELVRLDQAGAWLDSMPGTPPGVAVAPEHLAYVIYTSGSTGRPKGAGNSHRALVNRLCWMQQAYVLGAGDVVLQKTPFSFDVSVWEFFWPLMTGARLVLAAPGAHRDPEQLMCTIVEYQVTTLHFVPSMLQAFIHHPGVERCSSLARIVCSGEALPLDAQAHVLRKLPAVGLYNLYGPTEAAIDVTHWTCVDEGAGSVPIGKPIANLRTLVLDDALNPVPPGAAGELYLGGVGLARGYHRRPGLTAERFVPCPNHAGERLYRTGDKARQRPDGTLEYLGRLDHQVKLRGLRIELGEVENQLVQHPGVREAVVLVVDNRHLVAWIVMQAEAQVAGWQTLLKNWLLGRLPEFMVPGTLVNMAALPVTANGKLDRRALPAPQLHEHAEYAAPQTPIERALADIWQALLGVSQVGLDDNFFDLGGDSIISMQAVSRARQVGIALNPRDLFQYQTLRSLAVVATSTQAVQVDQGPLAGDVLLTPVQHTFFEQQVPVRHHWNQSLLLRPRQPLQAQWLAQALEALVTRHDALRLRFEKSDAGWRQWHAQAQGKDLLWLANGEDDEALGGLYDNAQLSLDLLDGPLFRALLVDMADGSQRLLLVIHHLVVDGVSWRILLDDLQHAYRQLARAEAVALPAKTSSYQAWAAHLAEHAASLGQQLPYWLSQQADADLPCAAPQGEMTQRLERKVEVRLDAAITRLLLQVAPAAYRTQVNDLLLAALAHSVCAWSGQTAMAVQLEGHGREDFSGTLDLTGTVGWFTSLFPLRLQPGANLGETVRQVKEQLRAVPDKGMGFGVLRYLGEASQRQALAAMAEPRITFNYLGQFDRQFDETALFVPAQASGGMAQDPHAPLANWLTVEGQVYEGELRLQWGYSEAMFDEAAITTLAEAYLASLRAIIEHCCQVPAGQATLSDFPMARLNQQQLDGLGLDLTAIEDVYPLSPMQQGMLFHTLYEPHGDAYVNQTQLDIQGLDLPRFERVWREALERHAILRSSFHWQGLESPHQVVHRQADLVVQVLDDTQADPAATAVAERTRGFELDTAPLQRLTLIRTGADDWHMIYTSHHILMDGWSNALLLGEVMTAYGGQQPVSPRGQFRDYLGWLAAQMPERAEQYWRAALSPLQAPTLLAQAVRAPDSGSGVHDYRVALELTFTQQLVAFARQHKVTPNTVLQGAWSVLLQRYCGQDHVVFGATVAGRSAAMEGIEQQLGLFINTLPMISRNAPSLSVEAWLAEVQATNLGMREFEHVPLYDLQGWAGQPGTALFDTLLVFENFPVAEALKQGAPAGLSFANLHNHERTNYPLTLGVELGLHLSLDYTYDSAYFSAAQIETLAADFHYLIAQMVACPQALLGSLQLLEPEAHYRTLALGAPRLLPAGSMRLAHQRIAEQAQATPHALALEVDGKSLTYGQLDRLANQLAHRLLAAGVQTGHRVGLALPRGPQLIVGLLAVLKSGAAYVPLDAGYPRERLRYMIDDSRLDLLLEAPGLLDTMALPRSLARLSLESLDSALDGYSDADPEVNVDPAHLAYVIYTSGSTGRPKGVAIDHAALRDFCDAAVDYSRLESTDRVLQFATYSFDGFVEQCYPALSVGAALIMRGDELWDAAQLAEHIARREVTLADLPAAYWFLLARECASNPGRSLGRLRQVHVGGEAMSVEGVRLWHQAGLAGIRLVNTYGPTEATVVSSVHECHLSDASDSHGVPIGRAIAGRVLYVLDNAGNLMAQGGVGELFIGAAHGLAQGYFDRPGLTAERFVPDPFAQYPGARLYRTGDLARFNPAGDLEYAGRIDHQLKIRGFRIELGEVEAALQALPHVREAAVVAQTGVTGAQLVGYVVPTDAALTTEGAQAEAGWFAELRQRLQASLPDYMIPAYLIMLTALPLNRNGKLDRSALPMPDPSQGQAEYAAPATLLQRQLACIWEAVLQVTRIGLQDHFFQLGGHSLLATQVISRVRQQLGLQVQLKALFEHPTLAAFAQVCDALQTHDQRSIMALARTGYLALSPAQERQWFLWQLDPTSTAYHVPIALALRGSLDINALQSAFDSLVARHESLRTRFVAVDGVAGQVIEAPFTQPIRHQVLACGADPVPLRAQVEAEISLPFDLDNGPLLRVALLQCAQDHHVLVITLHHIVSDGWSMNILVEELVQFYRTFTGGGQAMLPALAVQYADYAAWQRKWLGEGEGERQLSYWRAQLAGEQGILQLPFDHPRPTQQSMRGARLDLTLPPTLGQALRSVAQQQGATLFMVMLAGFQVLLHRYSGQSDIRVGVPIANRNRVETEGLIGFFVNTQVLKAEIDPQVPFTHLLGQVRQTVLDAQAHQDLPFEQLVDALQPQRSLSHSPLFQVLFNYRTLGRRALHLPALEIDSLVWDVGSAQFDLALDIEEDQDLVTASFTYATDLFERSTLKQLSGHWLTLMQAIAADPAQQVGELEMLGAEQRQQLLQVWNEQASVQVDDGCIHQRIEAQVQRDPARLAMIFGQRELSYAQLDQRASALAMRLRAHGVGAEVRVGVLLPRTCEMVVALLAVLKAGGVYVPLDPNYPAERVAYMLEDSQAQVLLSDTEHAPAAPCGAQVVLVDGLSDIASSPPVECLPYAGADNLAYVIYTSGSTGRPKGVAITHRNALALIDWALATYAQSDLEGVLASTSICFDLSVWELFVTLAGGGYFVLAENALALPELPARDRVTLINTVPSAAAALQRDGQIPASVRIVNLAGEPLKQGLVDDLYTQGSIEHVYDLYGPSEDTTYSTFTRRQAQGVATIGRPLAGTGAFVLDSQIHPVPVGVAGELYLAGAGLSRGYLNRAGLTAERYLPSPFGGYGERMYRTGDLVRYLADGRLQYIGRTDHQIKVRGFRIELGEIEKRLLAHAAVAEAAVLARESTTGAQLVAYLVLRSLPAIIDEAALLGHLRDWLRQALPDYMVPAYLVCIEELPLTPNGKLDRKALPEPGQPCQADTSAPVTAAERVLADVWQDVLGAQHIGVDANFFEVGGDSIVSIQVVSRARARGLHFSAKELFQHQTIRELARVARLVPAGAVIDQGPVTGMTKLLPIQHDFFSQAMIQRHHWNQSLLLKPARVVEAGALAQALQLLVKHHDALRLRFDQKADGWLAMHVDQPHSELLWQAQADDEVGLTALCQEAQRSLDLAKGPLLRALLVNMGDGSQRLLLVIHHLVVDGVSWRLLLEDLQKLYTCYEAEQTPALPAKTHPFQLWAERLHAHAGSPELKQELAYWLSQQPTRELPCDDRDGSLANCHGLTVQTRLDAEQTRRLLQEVPSAYRTQINDVLLTALARVICRWSADDAMVVQLEGHGREDVFDDIDLSRTVGWFTSLYPVRLQPQASLEGSIKAIKEQLRAVPNKGIGFGMLRHLGDAATQETLGQLVPARITFNYLGQFDNQFEPSALFVPATEHPGDEQAQQAPLANWLSIDGRVYGGELSLDWSFSGEMYAATTVERLAQALQVELLALVDHCCQPQAGGVTPSDFPLARLTQPQLDALAHDPRAVEDIYPLSPMQQGMMFHSLLEQSRGDYINQMRVTVDGLDAQRFRLAWQQTLLAHQALRSSFVWGSGQQQPLQIVLRDAELPFIHHDWRGREQLATSLDAVAQAERDTGFSLEQAPLLRLVLVRTDDNRHELIYTSHHILMDGWSNSQLLGEVLQRYQGLLPAPVNGRYAHYIEWLQRQDALADEGFWRQQLAGLEQPTLLTRSLADAPAAGALQGQGHHGQWLDQATTRRLEALAKGCKVTVNTLVQGAWLLLLQRHTGQATVAFGATVSGRPAELPDIEHQVGLFINTLPVIACVPSEQPLAQWLQQLQHQNLALREHEHTPLFDIQRWAGLAGSDLFDTLLVFENYPVSAALEQGAPDGVRFGAASSDEQTSLPLTVLVDLGEQLSLQFAFDMQRFTQTAIERLAGQLHHLLVQMIQAQGSERVGNFTLLEPAEHCVLVETWNATANTDYP